MSTTSFPSWTLVAFSNQFGKPKYIPSKEFTNTKTGEIFTRASLGFESSLQKDEKGRNKVTFVAFSSKAPVPTPSELMRNVDDYQIIQIESGSYICCKKGESSWIDLTF